MVNLVADHDINYEKRKFKEYLKVVGFEEWHSDGECQVFTKSYYGLNKKDDMELNICCDINTGGKNVVVTYCLFGFGGEINIREELENLLFLEKTSEYICEMMSAKINKLVRNFDFSFIENLKNA